MRAEHDEHGHSVRSHVAHPVGAASEQIGGVEEQGELHELGWLHAPRAGAEPAAGAVDGQADAGQQHEDEQPEADEQPERGELAPEVVVDAHRDEQRDEAEHASTSPAG